MTETFYDLLGVPADASTEEIHRAFRRRVREHHPDRNDDPDATERMQRINRARDVLTDPAERRRYDRLGHEAYVAGGTGTRDQGDGPAGSGSDSRTGPGSRSGSRSGAGNSEATGSRSRSRAGSGATGRGSRSGPVGSGSGDRRTTGSGSDRRTAGPGSRDRDRRRGEDPFGWDPSGGDPFWWGADRADEFAGSTAGDVGGGFWEPFGDRDPFEAAGPAGTAAGEGTGTGAGDPRDGWGPDRNPFGVDPDLGDARGSGDYIPGDGSPRDGSADDDPAEDEAGGTEEDPENDDRATDAGDGAPGREGNRRSSDGPPGRILGEPTWTPTARRWGITAIGSLVLASVSLHLIGMLGSVAPSSPVGVAVVLLSVLVTFLGIEANSVRR